MTPSQPVPKSKRPEYRVWCSMKTRCSNPRHVNYGGRGISVCARWAASFDDFFADMGERPSAKHSIDRIDNDGNYEPGNCRWATATEQANNTRRVRGRPRNYRDQFGQRCLHDIGAPPGIPTDRLSRLRRGLAWRLWMGTYPTREQNVALFGHDYNTITAVDIFGPSVLAGTRMGPFDYKEPGDSVHPGDITSEGFGLLCWPTYEQVQEHKGILRCKVAHLAERGARLGRWERWLTRVGDHR